MNKLKSLLSNKKILIICLFVFIFIIAISLYFIFFSNNDNKKVVVFVNSDSELKYITDSIDKPILISKMFTDSLNVKYNSFATPKSFNTMYGLMNAINNFMDKFSDTFVAEMGAFYRGEIKEKAEFIRPQYGILTTIGRAHLESFGSQENIQQAKFELIDSLPDDGVAVLNMDDPYQTSYKIKSKCKVIWVSIGNKDADVCASNIKLSSKGTTFTCTFKNTKEKCDFETKLLGNANVYNVLQAIAMSYELGMNLEQIQIGVKRIQTIEHRLELKKYGEITIYGSEDSLSRIEYDKYDE